MSGIDELIVAGDAAVLRPAIRLPDDTRPFTTIDELAARASQYHARGKSKLAAAIGQIRQGAESPQETRLRLLLVRSGFPEPELNVNVYDDAGVWLARVDMLYRAQRVVVEYDGDQHRTVRAIYEKDQRRIDQLTAADFTVVRVRSPGLTFDTADTLYRVRRALRKGTR